MTTFNVTRSTTISFDGLMMVDTDFMERVKESHNITTASGARYKIEYYFFIVLSLVTMHLLLCWLHCLQYSVCVNIGHGTVLSVHTGTTMYNLFWTFILLLKSTCLGSSSCTTIIIIIVDDNKSKSWTKKLLSFNNLSKWLFSGQNILS